MYSPNVSFTLTFVWGITMYSPGGRVKKVTTSRATLWFVTSSGFCDRKRELSWIMNQEFAFLRYFCAVFGNHQRIVLVGKKLKHKCASWNKVPQNLKAMTHPQTNMFLSYMLISYIQVVLLKVLKYLHAPRHTAVRAWSCLEAPKKVENEKQNRKMYGGTKKYFKF